MKSSVRRSNQGFPALLDNNLLQEHNSSKNRGNTLSKVNNGTRWLVTNFNLNLKLDLKRIIVLFPLIMRRIHLKSFR